MKGLCGAFVSFMRGCVVLLYQLLGVVWCLYISYEGLCCAFKSVTRNCVVPLYQL